ncbi:DUF2628 domain-containing protein [Rhizobium sp. PAMB 3182]
MGQRMASYIVLTSPDGLDRDHALTKVIRDSFSLTAFLVPALWLYAHRLWIAGSIALVLQVVALQLFGISGFGWAGLALLLTVSLVAALEGRMHYIRLLEADGWKLSDIVTARNLGDAEAIYFAGLQDGGNPPPAAARPAMPPSNTRPRASEPGLFGFYDPEGGRN